MAGILKVDRVQSDSNLAFQVGSANVAYINSTGLNITGGEIIAGGSTLRTTSGMIYANNGIAFPATQVSSADPNTLDDYEEGTWTPVLGGTGGASGQTYSAGGQYGYYTKIGNMCYATGFVNLSVKGTFIGSYVCLTGLPFTGVNADWQLSVGYYGGLANSKVYVGGYTSGTVVVFSGKSAASTELAVSAFGQSDIQNGTFMAFSFSYRTA